MATLFSSNTTISGFKIFLLVEVQLFIFSGNKRLLANVFSLERTKFCLYFIVRSCAFAVAGSSMVTANTATINKVDSFFTKCFIVTFLLN